MSSSSKRIGFVFVYEKPFPPLHITKKLPPITHAHTGEVGGYHGNNPTSHTAALNFYPRARVTQFAMASPANKRQPVAQGGMFSTPKANFSRETQELLKGKVQI